MFTTSGREGQDSEDLQRGGGLVQAGKEPVGISWSRNVWVGPGE